MNIAQLQDLWIGRYKERNAFWLHDGNPKRPHAHLTSDNHSNGFFNSELVMEDPCLLDLACQDLTTFFPLNAGLEADRVVGPAMGAITFAHDMARHMSRLHSRPCLRAYVEKVEEDGHLRMTFTRTKIQSGERVLIVEDVLTTGTSVERTAQAVIQTGGTVLPMVVVLVNRSGLKDINGKKIIALIDCEMPTWTPDECPLCRVGSKALRPKSKENWIRLNADY